MIFAAFLAVVAAQDVTPAAPPPSPPMPLGATLLAGTPLRLTTVAALNSATLVQGQRVALTIADDVRVGSRLVIARGTPAVGEIEALAQKGMFGKAAKFSLRPLFVDLNGQRVNLVGGHDQQGKKGVAAAAVTTVLFGVMGIIITGKSATLPANSVIHGAIRNDVLIAASAANPDGRLPERAEQGVR